jgi:hypothetical protein
MFDYIPGWQLFIFLVFPAPIWIPIVFAAYAIGRRRFGLGVLMALMTAEALSLGLLAAINRLGHWPSYFYSN